MIKYIIKSTNVANENNPSFAGETHIFYYGKNQCLLASKISDNDNTLEFLNVMAKEYGYNKECDAKKSYIYRTRFEDSFMKYWTRHIEIVKMEV